MVFRRSGGRRCPPAVQPSRPRLLAFAAVLGATLGCEDPGGSSGDDDSGADPCGWALPGEPRVDATVDGTGMVSLTEPVYDLTTTFELLVGLRPTAGGDAVTLTLDAFHTSDGRPIAEALAGTLPAHVALGESGGGGLATVIQGGIFYSTDSVHDGFLIFAASDAGELRGCFSFVAADGADTVVVDAGAFRAGPFTNP